MLCKNCNNNLKEEDKFCTKCGSPVIKQSVEITPTASDEKWWYRLLKVIYIFLYIPLPFLLWLVWEENATSWSYYGSQDTTGSAIWYTFITLVIYMVIIRLIKLACLYIAVGQKPNWKKEFKRLF